MVLIKIGTNGFWLETEHVNILDFFKIKELYLGVDMQNQQKPNNVYFAVNSESGLKIRALSYNKFRGSTKLYFWNTQEEIKSFLKPVKRMYILDEGIWADNGYYMVFG